MNTNTYNTSQLTNFTILRDGQVDPDFQPSITGRTVSHFTGIFTAAILQLHLLAYDTLHGTHYRTIRNQLVDAKRNAQFEQRIGLIKK